LCLISNVRCRLDRRRASISTKLALPFRPWGRFRRRRRDDTDLSDQENSKLPAHHKPSCICPCSGSWASGRSRLMRGARLVMAWARSWTAKLLSPTKTMSRSGNRRQGWRAPWQARSVSSLCLRPRWRSERSDGAGRVSPGRAVTTPAHGEGRQPHEAQPVQAAGLDELAMAGADGTAIDAARRDLPLPPAFGW